MFFADIADAKVVDDEGEADWSGEMGEDAGCVLHLDVSVKSKVGDESIIGKAAGLGKAVHCIANFGIDMAIVDEGPEVVLVHDGFGDHMDWNPDVFVAGHGMVEVEVFEINGHETSKGGGEDLVENDLGFC